MIMSTSKGSKIAMAVAGLILVAGAATAIAMTQKDGNAPLPLIGTEESAPSQSNEITLPAPSAETGEATPGAFETVPNAEDEGVPGMNNLENAESPDGTSALIGEPEQKTE
jgi:hypothetical protein